MGRGSLPNAPPTFSSLLKILQKLGQSQLLKLKDHNASLQSLIYPPSTICCGHGLDSRPGFCNNLDLSKAKTVKHMTPIQMLLPSFSVIPVVWSITSFVLIPVLSSFQKHSNTSLLLLAIRT